MSKKMILSALAVVSAAMFAMPAPASANFNHLSATGAFTVHGPEGNLNTVNGQTLGCKTTTGVGEFTATTTGGMKLVFHNCTTTFFGFTFNCTTPGHPTGTIATSTLGVHLVTIDNTAGSPGVLVTPPAGGQFAHFECAGQTFAVTGNGVIGTVTSPRCGISNTTATVDFNRPKHGDQEHRSVTGTSYGLFKNAVEAAIDTHATITFEGSRMLTCT